MSTVHQSRSTSISRGEEADGGEQHQEERANDQLHARAGEDAEEHGELDGGPEHVRVHELPPGLLPLVGLLFVGLQLRTSQVK